MKRRGVCDADIILSLMVVLFFGAIIVGGIVIGAMKLMGYDV